MKHSFCENWEFTRHWTEAFGKGLPVPKQQAVRLPHTCREVPLHYASPADYEMVCGYRKRFRVPPVQAAPRLFLRFDGAAHQAVVRVNGRVAGQHRGGYTGFAVEITDLVDREGENLLTVQLDTREDPTIPPFGFVIDYLTYGGLYREVWLEATAESRLTDLFVYTPTLHDAVVQWTAELTPAAVAVRIRLETADGTLLAEQTAQAAETGKMQLSVTDAQPWDTENPVLHHATAELLNAAGQPIDRKQVVFGFRTAEFREDGFYLNGKKTFLRGLNRHQSYPYIGYAAPESLQREDARILQEELHCTAVRTSHYPQSQYFLDECDRRGLLVFTELPGWQHIGDDNWKDAACEMLREMLLQNRSHPSIILWGVRINESVDDDAFYTRTNEIAHQEKKLAGYSSWYNRYQDITEDTIREDLTGCRSLLCLGDLFQIDDGWEPEVGDWLETDAQKFPHGLKGIVEEIHAAGFQAGLWLAPFVCEKDSALFRQHPDWLLKVDGAPWCCGCNWSSFYALDLDNPAVLDYLRRVFDRVLNDWGFDLVKLDFLYGAAPFGNARESRAARMYRAMELLRSWCGQKTILGCGVPVMPAFGLVDYCRVSCDVGLDWDDVWYMRLFHRERVSTKQAINNTLFRRQLNGRAYGSDPDVFFLREENCKLTAEQKRTLATVNALLGNVFLTSDMPSHYTDAQRAEYRRLRTLFEHATQVQVETENDRFYIRYLLDGTPQKLSFTPF